jgi:Na+-translocating ferredoxin:NAD+ oxidoreductase RNF subunit RnfB
MSLIGVSVLTLCIIGVIGAGLLFWVAKRFYVEEDPRIAEVESLLPGANCGGCGCSGCHDFAVKYVTGDGASLNCPGAGEAAMCRIAEICGRTATAANPMIAVLKCNGSCDVRRQVSSYDGARSCSLLSSMGVGTQGCSYGCLGCGDCATVCPFGAISISELTKLPEVDQTKCVGCGKCVSACPRRLMELRAKGKRDLRVYVACSNKDKGAVSRKDCTNSCIGCGKCAKTCPFEAITVNSNLAYIDFNKCRMCRKCVDVCPTHAIHAVNFPVKKETENVTTNV